jgi:uncharacterized protein HemX
LNTETDPEFDPFANEKKSGGSSKLTTAVAYIAFFLIMVFGGINVWEHTQQRNAADTNDSLQRSVSSLQTTQDALQRRLAQTTEQLEAAQGAGLEAELEALKVEISGASSINGAHLQRIEVLEQALQAATERLQASENALAALAVRGESPARRMEMAEVDYLLRTASERLQLFADQRSAARALALADAQLLAIDDPLYTPVRQQIAIALNQLEALPDIDGVALNAAISALQESVPALPLRGQWGSQPLASAPQAAEAGVAEPGIWARFKATLAGLVTVQRRNPEQALVSIGDQQYVRQGLWLQLESARLALMRRDHEAYVAALDRARDVIGQFFAEQAPAVLDARAAIAELLDAPLQTPLPDISAPWAELQRLNQVRAPQAPRPAARPAPEPVAGSAPEPTPVAAVEPAAEADGERPPADDEGGPEQARDEDG